jgi:hypothetical protein
MLCYVMLCCYIMLLCHVMLCYVMLCYIILYYIILYYIILYYIIFTCMKVIIWRVRVTVVALQNQEVSHILSVCVQSQVSSMQLTRTKLPSMARPAAQHFSTLSPIRYDFRGKRIY